MPLPAVPRLLLLAVICGTVSLGLPAASRAADPAVRELLWTKLSPFTRPPEEFARDQGKYRSPLLSETGEPAGTPEAWRRRRSEILAKWHTRLGPWPPLLERPRTTLRESIQRDGYTEHHLVIEVGPDGLVTDGYLLVPEGEGPFPAVLVPFYEPLTSLGRGERGRGTHDYGLQLVRRGFVTLSVGTPGAPDRVGGDTRELLTDAGRRFQRQPLTLLAYAAANCHTVLSRRPEVDPRRIGIIGLSYGGKWSMFASCLYEKFDCAVWSDPGIVFDETNANVNYWEPWYLGYDPATQRSPGVPTPDKPRTGLYKDLYESGEDLVDLHALMAPRPVLVSGGTEDPPRNWRALNHLVAITALLGEDSRVALTSRATHIPTAEALQQELDFLEYWLQPGRPRDTPSDDPPRFVTAWGREGEQPGEFFFPIGIAINAADEIFVTDHYNSRVQKFDTAGRLLASFPVLPNPGGICVDTRGRLCIVHFPASRLRGDKTPDRVSLYSPAGEFLAEWGSSGKCEGQFDFAGGVAPGPQGNLYVADQTNRRVQVFDPSGQFLFQWGRYGTGPGEFGGTSSPKSRVGGPQFVAFDSTGHLYTTEASPGRIQKFTADGQFVLSWGDNSAEPGGFGGEFLAMKTSLKGPVGVCVDRRDRLWVAAVSGRIQQFSNSGRFLRGFGYQQGTGPGEFQAPHGLAMDSRGDLYVVDSYNHRVQKFRPAD